MRTLLSAASLLIVGAGFAQAPADADVHTWIDGPDHEDIKWRVMIAPPHLIYDQRQVVWVYVSIPAKKLQEKSVERELYFTVKATDSSGRWYAERSTARGKLTRALAPRSEVTFVTRLLMRSGRREVAVVLYDAVLRQHNVAHKWVTVPEIGGDPLPALGRNVPDVDFLARRPATCRVPEAQATSSQVRQRQGQTKQLPPRTRRHNARRETAAPFRCSPGALC